MPTDSQQTTQSETSGPSAAETADPLFYPSWYKGQSRKTSSNPPCTPGSEGLGQIGPPGAENSSVQSAQVAEASANEQAAVSGKESSSTAATSQVSVDARCSLLCLCASPHPLQPCWTRHIQRAKGSLGKCSASSFSIAGSHLSILLKNKQRTKYRGFPLSTEISSQASRAMGRKQA